MAITKVIPPIPPAPRRSNPVDFDAKAEAFLTRLETLDEDLNEWASQVNTTQSQINSTISSAVNNAVYAATSKVNQMKEEVLDAKDQVEIYHSDVVNLKAQINGYYYNVRDWYNRIIAIAQSLSFKGEWVDGTVANIGDVYGYAGALWISLIDNNTAAPAVDAGWLPMGGDEFLNASSLIKQMIDGIGWLWNAVTVLQSYVSGLQSRVEELERKVELLTNNA